MTRCTSFPHRILCSLMDEASKLRVSDVTCYAACIPKGFRTMLSIYDTFNAQMRDRLKTVGIGLGLVRLLQDVGLADEAKATLSSLENSFQKAGKRTARTNQKTCHSERLRFLSSAVPNTSRDLVRSCD